MADATDAAARKTVLLHIGTRKSGTSFLQKAWRGSQAELAHQGLRLLYPDRDKAMRELSAPLALYGSEPGELTRAAAQQAVDALVDAISAHAELRQLLSLESLAGMPAHVAELVMDGLRAAGHEVHLLLTVRHWGRTIPSEWQQSVKEGLDQAYPDFIAAVRDSSATTFLERHDVVGIIGRWAATVPRERWRELVHVIACPPPHSASPTLLELASEVLEVDATTLRAPTRTANVSLGLGQAEILRRVNQALGDRPDKLPSTQRVVRKWVALGTLATQSGRRISIPEKHAEWVAATVRDQHDGLLGLGIDLRGEPADLLTESIAVGDNDVSDSEIARIAVQTIADLILRHETESVQKDAVIAGLRAELARFDLTGEPPRTRWWRRR